MPKYLLDSSAVLAMLFNEPGGNETFKHIYEAAISSVNYSEVIAKLIQKGANPKACKKQLESLIEMIIPFDENTAFASAVLVSQTNQFGLSLGDRACLGTAMSLGLEILTSDKIWSKLSLPIKIHIVR